MGLLNTSLPTLTMSVGVGKFFEYVCLSVCPYNSKKNELGVGNEFGIPRSGTVLRFKGQGHRVNNTAQ